MMTLREINAIEAAFSSIFKNRVPYTPHDIKLEDGRFRRRSTGNMRFNATKLSFETNTAIIKVDSNIATYVVYTNEPWISPKWHGLTNPHEKWFEYALDEIAVDIARQLKGKLIIRRTR